MNGRNYKRRSKGQKQIKEEKDGDHDHQSVLDPEV
jgi:hypothetical protein